MMMTPEAPSLMKKIDGSIEFLVKPREMISSATSASHNLAASFKPYSAFRSLQMRGSKLNTDIVQIPPYPPLNKLRTALKPLSTAKEVVWSARMIFTFSDLRYQRLD